MALSPQGNRLAFVLDDKRVIVWDLKADRHTFTLQANFRVSWLFFSPDGNRLLATGGSGGGRPFSGMYGSPHKNCNILVLTAEAQ